MRAPPEVNIGNTEGTFRHGAWADYLRTLSERVEQLRPLPVYRTLYEAADWEPPAPPVSRKTLKEQLSYNAS